MGEGKKKIIVAGHISLDITPVFQNSGKQKIGELFQPGKLLRVGEAMMSAGGSVSNTGLGLKRLGADAVLMAKIGDDSFGNILKSMLDTYGCEMCVKQVPGEHTSYTIALAPKGIDRFFLHDPGCNDTFGYEDVDFEQVAEAAHFHFGYPPIMRRFYLNDGEELVELYKKIKSMGLTTSLDLVAVDPDSEAAKQNWERILERVLPYVDFFVPSIEELGYMLAPTLYDRWQGKAAGEDVTGVLSLSEDVRPLAEKAVDLGARCVLLKCGAAGMYIKTASKPVWEKYLPEFSGWEGINHFEDSYVPDRILSGTGAGDTSIAAFIKAMLDGCPPLECVRLSVATGASCITAYDSLSGLLSFDEMRDKIQAGWEKQHIIRP